MSSLFTWQMAERLAENHMRSIGFRDAELTPAGADGGIDVTSTMAVAQVKYYSVPVGIADVQRLRGATGYKKVAVFYASSGYTNSALKFAETAHVALFVYEADSIPTPVNEPARELAVKGFSGLFAQLQELFDVGRATNDKSQKLSDHVMGHAAGLAAKMDLPEMQNVTALTALLAEVKLWRAATDSDAFASVLAEMRSNGELMSEIVDELATTDLFVTLARVEVVRASTSATYDKLVSIFSLTPTDLTALAR